MLKFINFSIKFLISHIPEKNWVDKVKRDLKPIIEPPFTISGSHYLNEILANKKVILVEATMAFGTGHHATTISCLSGLVKPTAGEIELFGGYKL